MRTDVQLFKPQVCELDRRLERLPTWEGYGAPLPTEGHPGYVPRLGPPARSPG